MKRKWECFICGKTITLESEIVDGIEVWTRNVCDNPKCNKIFDNLSEEELTKGYKK